MAKYFGTVAKIRFSHEEVTVGRRNVTEIGSVLYVHAALRIDELYVPANLDDHIWFEERKRHHKRLWMRLMRWDFLSARTTLRNL